MSLGKSIEITVSPNGEVQIEAKGYEGGECLKATKSLEELLGKVQKRTSKEEMLKQPQVAEKAKLGR